MRKGSFVTYSLGVPLKSLKRVPLKLGIPQLIWVYPNQARINNAGSKTTFKIHNKIRNRPRMSDQLGNKLQQAQSTA